MRPAPAGGGLDPPLSVAALWRDTVAVAQRNSELLGIVAAAFLFLPQLVAAELQPVLGGTPQRPSLVPLLVVALAGLVGQGAIALIVHDDLAGGQRTLREALALAGSRLPRLFAGNLAAGLAIGIGLVALVIPGLWLLGRLAAVTPVIMAEGRDTVSSLERSWALSEGRAWPAAVWMTLNLVLLLSLLFTAALVGAALQATATLAGGEALGKALVNLALAAVSAGAVALLNVAQAVLYRHLLVEAGAAR
ncbi:MAG: hypothetical protein ACK40H_07505 [Sphingomonadaceae bacterium]